VELTILEKVLWPAVYAAQWGLLAHLWRTGLWRRYRNFTAYLLGLTAQDSVLLWLNPASAPYAYVYVAGIVPIAVLSLLAVGEIYQLALQPYRGIQTLSRWVLSGAMLIAVVVSVATVALDFTNPAEPYPILRAFNAFQRTFSTAIILFLLAVNAYLVYFPVPTNRNTVTHTQAFLFYFAARTAAFLVRNVLGPEVVPAASAALLGVDLLCLGWWIVRLVPQGEAQPRPPNGRWSPAEAEVLLRQLEQLNSKLSGSWWRER